MLAIPAAFAAVGVALKPGARAANGVKPASTVASTAPVHFEDITRQAGINFVHYTGAFGKKYLPETMGAGCAFIDYDNDGNPDILLVNGQGFSRP